MPFFVKKSSGRLILLAALSLCTIFLITFANQQQHRLESGDLRAMTQWNLNKNLQISRNDSKTIQRIIDKYNKDQVILNEEKYGPIQNDSIVIVVQVHTRIQYLKHLIVSLAQARDISKTLVIFSHDFYDENINELVQSIDFCRVIQIFFPFSIQTHPYDFPGTEINDCKRDMRKRDAIREKCTNAHFPDKYGHYREASFTQMKHHFWWKLNRIFDELDVTRNLDNFHLLLLEEDHVVSPDVVPVFKLLRQLSARKCPYCNMLSLGTYTSEYIEVDSYNKVEISPWLTSKHNMGFSFNRTTWNEIKTCAKYFCSYDEYNYDWSLQNVNYNCLEHKLVVMIVKAPRVFHIGECGMHHHKNCDSSKILTRISSVIEHARYTQKLFPKKLKIIKVYTTDDVKDTLNNNGGWADLRDEILCLNMTISN